MVVFPFPVFRFVTGTVSGFIITLFSHRPSVRTGSAVDEPVHQEVYYVVAEFLCARATGGQRLEPRPSLREPGVEGDKDTTAVCLFRRKADLATDAEVC